MSEGKPENLNVVLGDAMKLLKHGGHGSEWADMVRRLIIINAGISPALTTVEAERRLLMDPFVNDPPEVNRVCSNCRFVRKGLDLHCSWEVHSMPPPVFRERMWGKDGPVTHDENALTCTFFQEKPDER